MRVGRVGYFVKSVFCNNLNKVGVNNIDEERGLGL